MSLLLQHANASTPSDLSDVTTPTTAPPPPLSGNLPPSDQSAEVQRLSQEVEELRRKLASEQTGRQQAVRRLEEVLAAREVRELQRNVEEDGGEVMERTVKSPMQEGGVSGTLPGGKGGGGGAWGEPEGPEVSGLVQVLTRFCAEARRISLPMCVE